MAVTVTQIYFLKDGLSGGQREEGQIIQQETLRVQFSSVVSTVRKAIQLIAGAGFRTGSQHPSDPIMFLDGDIDTAVLIDEIGNVWDFELSYSTIGANPRDNSNTGTYRPEVLPGSWTYTEVVDRDKETGEAFLNPARDPIDPLPIEVISAPTFAITIQEYADFMSRQELVGSINSAAITICGTTAPKYCVMLDRYVPKPFWDEEGRLTFRNTFHLKFKFKKNKDGNRIGFKLESAESGFNQIVATVKQAIKVKDPDGGDDILTSVPVLLAKNGTVTTIPFYKERVAHDLIDFSQFGLPTAYPVI